ncbi:MAG: metallophosphoesterase family protein, partial [Planctomycetaceae bacterium]|nr:metallophosphoesterase family protein [Planctomycetaceae bacterium]
MSALESLEVRIVPARVNPYLQNPATDAMTIMWFTQENVSGTLTVNLPGGPQNFASTPVLASALAFHPDEVALLPGGIDPGVPYQHRIRVTGLQAGTSYNYTVTQGNETFNGTFKTIPDASSSVRFVVYGDSETEPESTGTAVNWDVPFSSASRQYVVDQTEGYKQNLNVIESRSPDFIGIAGDIVESGGEQRDWEEFWRHNSGDLNDVGRNTPIFAAPGNHENFGGPGNFGGYGDVGAARARDKFSTYWEAPSNGSAVSTYQDRYYRYDYGPITYIVLDVTNGLPNQSSQDTNWFLGPNPGFPDFNPGSEQYQWLEAQLADAQSKSQFTFVQFHHVPYSVGPHGFPAGNGTGFDTQSGVPVRALTPLFLQYGVDGVFSGHDEQYQHSVVNGLNFYDIGIGGDGLRGPESGTDGSTGLPTTNPFQVFTAHLNAPEVWNGNQLVSGGKHYGHMEVNVYIDSDGFWKAKLEPVYVFPLMNSSGTITGWERRVYDDVVVLVGNAADGPVGDTIGVARESQFLLDGNANHMWDSTSGGDIQFQFGSKTDIPIVGDWDGDGVDQIAVFRGGTFYYDYNGNGKWDGPAGGDWVRRFGNPSDIPIAGDWDGDGDDEIGVFRNGEWYLDANGNGTWENVVGGDMRASFGIAGDKPVPGDWNGDGDSDVGIFRNGYWYLDVNGNHKYDGPISGDAKARFGNATDIPIVGDWNNDGKDKIGV